jgi:hypothetical protein
LPIDAATTVRHVSGRVCAVLAASVELIVDLQVRAGSRYCGDWRWTPGPFILPVRCARNRSGVFVQYVPEKLSLHEGWKCQGTGGFLRFAVGLGWDLRFDFVARLVWFACGFAGIRGLSSCFMRRPCAGRHLLFFAAAKKSRGGFKDQVQHFI